MSVRVMALVWERDDLDPYERLVMLSLADHADDEGVCYPSIKRLCNRTGMKERGVQTVMRRLIEKGFVSVEMNAGRKGSNLYTLHPTPAPDAPRMTCTPAPDAPHPRTGCTPTPAPDADEPSLNHQETSVTPKAPKPDDVSGELVKVAGSEAASSFIAYRKRSKGKALTLTAAKRLASNLQAIFDAGGDPDDALGMAEERGWLTVKPDWYFRERSGANDNRSGSTHSARRERSAGFADEIAIAARLGTPSR